MKCGRNNPAKWTVLGRVASCSAIAALLLNPALSPAIAADSESHLAPMATAASKTRFLALGVGKSVVIDLSRDDRQCQTDSRGAAKDETSLSAKSSVSAMSAFPL